MAADGSLKFDTQIEIKGFKDGINDLKNAMGRLTSAVEKLTENIVRSFQSAGEAAEAAGAKVQQSADAVEAVGDAAEDAGSKAQRSADSVKEIGDAAEKAGTKAQQSADAVEEIGDAAKKAEEETASLQEQMDAIQVHRYDPEADAGDAPVEPRVEPMTGDYVDYGNEVQKFVDDYANNMGKAEQYTNEFKQEIGTLEAKLKELESQGMYFGDDEYDETYLKLAKVKQALADYKKEMLSPTPDAIIFPADSLMGKINRLKKKLAELNEQGKTFGNSEYDSIYQALAQAEKELQDYKRSLLQADQGQKSVDKSAKMMKSSIDRAGKSVKGTGKGLKNLGVLGKSILFSFVLRAVNTVITAVKEGFQNLAQYSGGVNTTLSGLTSSLLYLKNSFAAGFAPILDFVVPALNAMIDAIANAIAWIGQLFAALTGKSTFVRAKKTQEDYAASLKKTGGAAKQAGKDAERSLAGFDKLNVISQKDSGDGGGSGGASGTDPSQMFETVEVDSKVQSMVDQAKQALGELYTWMVGTFGPNIAKVWDDMQPHVARFKEIVSGIWSDLGTLATPLQEWFFSDLVPLIQQIIDTSGSILNGLFESFNMVFSDIWNLAVFPFLENFVTAGLPMMTQFLTELVATLQPVFDVVKDIFDRIWRDAVAPALELVTQIWTDCVDTLYSVWQEYGHPIFELVREAISLTGDTLNRIWDKYIKPVFETFMEKADELWNDHLQPLLENFLEFGAKFILVALDIYNNVILPLVNWFADLFGPAISGAIQAVITVFGTLGGVVADIISAILKVLGGFLDFIHTGFTDGWDAAWAKVGEVFRGVFNRIVDVAENAINFIIDCLNGISFDVPDWIPFVGGSEFGFDLDHVNLPHLATGTVVPPRAGEFAAILGDNNREAEVVSPLSTIKQALKEAVSEMGGGSGGDIQLTINLDGKVIYNDIVKRNRQMKRQTGKNLLLT